MFIKNLIFKKTISSLLITVIIIPSIFLMQPKKIEAITVVEVGLNKITNVLNTAEQYVQSAFAFAMDNKEFILDGIAWQVAKIAVRQMTTSIVNWINNGFEGNPLFVTDFKGMMTDIADGVIGEYIYGSKLAFLCSPFSLEVKLALYNTFYGGSYKPVCTLSDAINNAGGALQSLEDDFRWGTWIEFTNKKSNNAYGAYLLAEENILKEIGLEQENKKLQVDWGEGFLSWEECEEVIDELTGLPYSKNCTTQTPGSVIATQLNNNLDSGREALITADEINEIIGALLTQLIKGVMSSTGLLGQSSSSYNNSENINELKNEIIETLNNSLYQEKTYNSIKNDSLEFILNAKKIIFELIDCLTVSYESEKLESAERFLKTNSIIPQSNIEIDLKSKETSLHNDLISSDKTILTLSDLINQANLSSSPNELSIIMDEYMSINQEIHTRQDVSKAIIERDGYGIIIEGEPNGISYDISLLLNTIAPTFDNRDGITLYPPETDKGIQQRLGECLVCKTNPSDCVWNLNTTSNLNNR
ncbi:hypothetical protein KKH36_00930 [Patescibacteria group bacterium]|nr:hypothetical protein [Patescibacteria group bacterium]